MIFRKRCNRWPHQGSSGPIKACFTFARCEALRQGIPLRLWVTGARKLLTSSHRIFVPAHFTTWKGSSDFHVEEEREFTLTEWLWHELGNSHPCPARWCYYSHFTDKRNQGSKMVICLSSHSFYTSWPRTWTVSIILWGLYEGHHGPI